jgi:hypothetical protein
MDMLINNLQSPIILFFILGIFAGLVKSDLEIPGIMARSLALYLIAAIGIKGGLAIASEPVSADFSVLVVTGILLGFIMPFIGYALLRRITRHSPIDAAAIAGHYGSVSLVTFIAAGEFLKFQTGSAAPGQFIALLAFMESPAILATLLIASRHLGERQVARRKRDIAREVFLNGTMVLLLGSMIIGFIMSPSELTAIEAVFILPFKGILCFFLLDMGLNIGRRGEDLRALGLPGIVFAIIMPLIGAVLAFALSLALGLDVVAGFLFMTLAASASYIAVPAALKVALPEANPALYMTLPLALTFPFNIALGIPLYYQLAQMFF